MILQKNVMNTKNESELNKSAYWTSMYEYDAVAIRLIHIASFTLNKNFRRISTPKKGHIAFLFCSEGRGHIIYKGKCYTLYKGNAFIMNIEDSYELLSESNNFKYYYIETSGDFIKKLYIHQLKDKGNIMPFNVQIISLWEKIYALASKDWSYESEIRISCLLYNLCGELMIVNMKNSVLEAAICYINEHYAEKIHTNTLSKLCFLGSSQFIKKFKEQYNTTPVNYLTNIRIDKAKSFLTNTDRSISEIAFLTGFNDPSYFTRIFRKLIGLTPKEYRRAVAESLK